MKIRKAPAGPAREDKIVRDYLSDQDTPATDESFPMIGLPNDVSRTDRAVRQAFETALKVMVDSFEKGSDRQHRSAPNQCSRHCRPLRRGHGPIPVDRRPETRR
jgi:hypothetical protein